MEVTRTGDTVGKLICIELNRGVCMRHGRTPSGLTPSGLTQSLGGVGWGGEGGGMNHQHFASQVSPKPPVNLQTST